MDTLQPELLQQVFDFIPGHHLMLRLVCKHWSAAYKGDKVTFISNVLQDVATFRWIGMPRMLMKPTLLYYHASYEVLQYLAAEGVDLAVITKFLASDRVRLAEYKLYGLLKPLLNKGKKRVAKYLEPDFAATPPEWHEWLLRRSGMSSMLEVIKHRYLTSSRPFHISFIVLLKVFPMAYLLYLEQVWLYVYGWSPIQPRVCREDEFPSLVSLRGLSNPELAKQHHYWTVLGREEPEVCCRFMELINRAIHLNASVGRAVEREEDPFGYLRRLRSNVDHLIARGYSITCSTAIPGLLPAYCDEVEMTMDRDFFEMRPGSVGGILGALWKGNLVALKAMEGEMNVVVMHLAVGLGHFHIVRWLRSRGLPVCGRLYADAAAGSFGMNESLAQTRRDMFVWMLDEGWCEWEVRALKPGELLILLERELIELDLRKIKALHFLGSGKTLLNMQEPLDADLWRLMDWLVRANVIYPSLLYGRLQSPYHDALVEGWSRDGYLDKPKECPIPVRFVPRTQAEIPKPSRGGAAHVGRRKQPLTAAQVERGLAFKQQALEYIEANFSVYARTRNLFWMNPSIRDYMNSLPRELHDLLKGVEL